jgi:Sec-independent protein secretion pathway component TatC
MTLDSGQWTIAILLTYLFAIVLIFREFLAIMEELEYQERIFKKKIKWKKFFIEMTICTLLCPLMIPIIVAIVIGSLLAFPIALLILPVMLMLFMALADIDIIEHYIEKH